MKHEYKISNGDYVIDKITGFKGIVTGSAHYLTGCNQYCVTAMSKDANTQAESVWFDEGRLSVIAHNASTQEEVSADQNGCDVPAPNQTKHPNRK